MEAPALGRSRRRRVGVEVGVAIGVLGARDGWRGPGSEQPLIFNGNARKTLTVTVKRVINAAYHCDVLPEINFCRIGRRTEGPHKARGLSRCRLRLSSPLACGRLELDEDECWHLCLALDTMLVKYLAGRCLIGNSQHGVTFNKHKLTGSRDSQSRSQSRIPNLAGRQNHIHLRSKKPIHCSRDNS